MQILFRQTAVALFMITLAGIMIVPFFPGQAFCAMQTVVVEGYAPLIASDVVQARDEALADARLRAVEQVAGVRVSAKAVFSQELMLDSMLSTSSDGFITSEKILDESIDDNGIYRLKLQAEVSQEGIEKRLRRLLRSDRVVLVVAESNLGDDVSISRFKNQLTRQLNQNGYEQIIGLRLSEAEVPNTPAEAEAYGLAHLADIVVAATISTRASGEFGSNLYSAHAEGKLKIFAVKEEKLLFADALAGIRGFGPDHGRAGTNSIAALSDRFSEAVMQHIAQRSLWELNVIFYDIPDFNAFKKYKQLLSLMRWVQNVTTVDFSPAKTVFKIRYAESPEILASRLQLFNDLTLVRFNSREIEVKVLSRME